MDKARALASALVLLALTSALGSVVGLVSVGFISLSEALFLAGVGAAGAHWLMVATMPALAGLASGWLCSRTQGREPPGPADVIIAKFEGLRVASLKDGMLGALASFGALSLGGSVGVYGPVVHLGSTLAAHLSNLLSGLAGARTAREVGLGCGCAAAIAAAFSAPLAGIVFAHEVIIRHYSLRLFSLVAAAALASNWVSRHLFDRPAFLDADVVTMEGLAATEILLFALVGLLCGLLACLIVKGCLGLAAWRAGYLVRPWLFPAVGGLLAGTLAVAVGAPEILGGGKPLIETVAAGDVGGSGKVALLLFAKLAATLLCIGLGMAGGLFSPSIVVGALFGYLCGLSLDALLPSAGLSSPVVYALVGMFATASPVIGAPLAGIMIAVEFSQHYELAISVAISIVVSSLVAARVAGGSYYQLQVSARTGTPVGAGAEQRVLSRILLRDRMRKATVATEPELGTLAGLDSKVSVWEALDRAGGKPGERIAVTEDGQVVGVVVVEDLLLEQASLNRRLRGEESSQ